MPRTNEQNDRQQNRFEKEYTEDYNFEISDFKTQDNKKDLIRHSTIPWNSFSGLLHPTNFDQKESVPKITFGKFIIQSIFISCNNL